MFFRAITCRSIFKSPISTDSIWYEIPIDREKTEKNNNSAKLIQDILIVRKKGYYQEEVFWNMPHIKHLLKPMIPQLPCGEKIKGRTYPLTILAESQEVVDTLFADPRI